MAVEIVKDNKTALVFNYSHIAAQALAKQLVAHSSYKKILLFDEVLPAFDHPKVECYALNFNDLETIMKGDDLFCFYSIQQEKKFVSDVKVRELYAFQIAKAAALNNVGQYLLLSSANTNKQSTNFNSRIRAHLEESVNALPFWSVHLFRPPLIVNTESDSRWGEKIADRLGRGLDRVTGGMISRYRPVEANLLAKSMLQAAQQLESGRFRYHPSYFVEMEKEAKGLRKLE